MKRVMLGLITLLSICLLTGCTMDHVEAQKYRYVNYGNIVFREVSYNLYENEGRKINFNASDVYKYVITFSFLDAKIYVYDDDNWEIEYPDNCKYSSFRGYLIGGDEDCPNRAAELSTNSYIKTTPVILSFDNTELIAERDSIRYMLLFLILIIPAFILSFINVFFPKCVRSWLRFLYKMRYGFKTEYEPTRGKITKAYVIFIFIFIASGLCIAALIYLQKIY